jgi:hypothetical protein
MHSMIESMGIGKKLDRMEFLHFVHGALGSIGAPVSGLALHGKESSITELTRIAPPNLSFLFSQNWSKLNSKRV